jgi:hypothetical protein
MKPFKTMLILWLAWCLIMISVPEFVQARFNHVTTWKDDAVQTQENDVSPYLSEPFLNTHVAWDSAHYLSIAIAGYDDPLATAVSKRFDWSDPITKTEVGLKRDHSDWVTLSHAFFPFYPLLIRGLMGPLSLLGRNPVATATLAGVSISCIGTLVAMLALYDLVKQELNDRDAGLRAAFYVLIFPSSMFLAQVYTEGLFLGLSFAVIALAKRQHWLWAAVLAILATWTRAAGIFLIIPMLAYWFQNQGLSKLVYDKQWKPILHFLLVCSPLFAYGVWSFFLGPSFHIVQDNFFHRGLSINPSLGAWRDALVLVLFGVPVTDGIKAVVRVLLGIPQAQAYYLLEFAAIAFGLMACFWGWKRHKLLVIYSLATILVSLFSSVAQGMHRYILAAPIIFLLPTIWGQNVAFDRIWTISNVLFLGIYIMAFSFDYWSG